MKLRAGAMLGSVRLVAPLGAGGMGSVWRGEDTSLGREVAVKVISTVAPDETAIARFKREATLAARIASPHVVQVYAHAVTDEGLPYIVMELLHGDSLAERLGQGPLDRAMVGDVIRQVARALTAAHELDVVHRDIKPANVFLVKDASYDVFVKVLDFGIAKDTEALGDDLTSTGAAVGTPSYMSPEQLTTLRGVDRRADLWSLGVMAYEMLTGTLPFRGETVGALAVAVARGEFTRPSALLEDGDTSFDAWCGRALQVDRDARFQTAVEMSDALRAALADRGQRAVVRSPADIDALAPTEEFLLAQRAVDAGAPTAPVKRRAEDEGASDAVPQPELSTRSGRGRWAAGGAVLAVAALGVGAIALVPGGAGPAAGASSAGASSGQPSANGAALPASSGASAAASAPLPSASAASTIPAVPRYLCPEETQAKGSCGKGSVAWCDDRDAVIACCGRGLVSVGHDGLCGCGRGGTRVKAALDAGCAAPASGPTMAKSVSEFLGGVRGEILACFDAARARNARAHGRLAIVFAADPEGHVFRARLKSTTHPDPEAQACAMRILGRLESLPPTPAEETTGFGIEMEF